MKATPTANKALKLDANAKFPPGTGLLGNNIAILIGTVAHGGTIPLPDGYTQAQCKWMVSMYDCSYSTGRHENASLGFRCYASADRVVTCQIKANEDGWLDKTANYMIIGIK